jgi:hypothetical protein
VASPRRALVAACALGALSVAGSARAAMEVGCQAQSAGERALVEVELRDLLDRELLRLVQLGLRGRIRIEAALYRRRRFWFDEREASLAREATLLWSRAESGFRLDGQSIEDPARLGLPVLALRSEGGRLGGQPRYVEVTARLEVVTVASLGQVASWLVRGEPGAGGRAPPAESPPSALSRTLISYLAADLARTATARCPVR